MNYKDKIYDVGIIIGRFQVPELHEAHKTLINYVLEKHKRIVIFIGVSPTLGTKANPLDFASRVGLFTPYMSDQFSSRIILHPLMDYPEDDKVWSDNLDMIIRAVVPIGSVCLYGGRKSFIDHYQGRFDTYELTVVSSSEGTLIRHEFGKKILNSPDFRAGQIYQSQNRYPVVYPTVDIAVLKDKGDLVLMGKKNNLGFAFPGGFVDPTDSSYEAAAKRELYEEVDVEVDNMGYVCSLQIEDARYNGEERIITSFYVCKYVFGSGRPKEEFAEGTEWVSLEGFSMPLVANSHKPLFKELLTLKEMGWKKVF